MLSVFFSGAASSCSAISFLLSSAAKFETCTGYRLITSYARSNTGSFWFDVTESCRVSSCLKDLTGESFAAVLFVIVLRRINIAVNGDLYFFCDEPPCLSFVGLAEVLIEARIACFAIDLNESTLDGLNAACTKGFAKASALGRWGFIVFAKKWTKIKPGSRTNKVGNRLKLPNLHKDIHGDAKQEVKGNYCTYLDCLPMQKGSETDSCRQPESLVIFEAPLPLNIVFTDCFVNKWNRQWVLDSLTPLSERPNSVRK